MTTTTAPATRLMRLVTVALVVAGCSLDGLLKSDELPPDVTDPAITQTPEGALAAYYGTLVRFQDAFAGAETGGAQYSFLAAAGLLGDELLMAGGNQADQRALSELNADNQLLDTYQKLNLVRAQAGQAIGLLSRYAPQHSTLVGHAQVLAGYAELFLAELFCSGIPLSTLDFDGDYTYRPGSTTREVFTHAVALFDTALALVGDNTRFLHLAQVGKARALLALGEYAPAATAAAPVPDDYSYTVSFTDATGANAQNFARIRSNGPWELRVADREGLNGLDYRTSGDPRTQVRAQGTYTYGSGATVTIWHPSKYDTTGASPIVLASGVEARLIEAEAALQAGDAATWLTTLNHLRQTAWPTIQPPVASPLPDTTDPGTAEGRVDLLFRERAFWLFLTGHRQGDLRRLIRQYGRTQAQTYPVGPYLEGPVPTQYGTDVTVPIPEAERVLNPYFTGCASRGA